MFENTVVKKLIYSYRVWERHANYFCFLSIFYVTSLMIFIPSGSY